MEAKARERAFKHDLFINSIWSDRFFDLVVKNLPLREAKTALYLNAGTGNGCFRLAEAAENLAHIVGICDSPDHLKIARDKAAATKSPVRFTAEPDAGDRYDIVIADATLVDPQAVPALISQAANALQSGGHFALIVPVAGSFAEIFSLLWEVLESGGEDGSGQVGELISRLPVTDSLIAATETAGLKDLQTEVSTEIFEYEHPEDFTDSPLFADFLLPGWLKDISESGLESIRKSLAALIKQEMGSLPFRFQVKAAVVTGKRS